ncbi:BON domain-containing protein [Sinorhizobium medicae]|uniref:Transport-associated n=4 Tax=Sinorhizobium medicae TaxID=110321 RepID=A0A508X3U9_9HYPH|nr:BON domain-containing protein [Sinorhizobium medicae]TWA25169.1 BON domain-containing protein [Sinorhizobium medicae]TWA38798.1 BON domain-containing protein [Sinorhizobium medicae]TWA38987.1 BON domain-containing protein [Sinorhizobium medicae]TWA40538.1 BON domain-containing protein [Sinorhizobium medicae]
MRRLESGPQRANMQQLQKIYGQQCDRNIPVLPGVASKEGTLGMPNEYPTYSHKDDDPHLTDDDLAAKVLHFLRYATSLDTSDMEVIALGNIVVLSGTVGSEADIATAGEAAASVIGVSSVENRLVMREGED